MSLLLQVDSLTSGSVNLSDLKLQLGCGTNLLPGWLNTDSAPLPGADYLDFTKPFPFSDGVFRAVFCEHTIEHISKAEAANLIAETRRVLRPGGAFRIVTPSLESFCRMALQAGSAETQKYLAFVRRFTNDPNAVVSDVVNLIFYGHGHRHIYMVDELGSILQNAGFVNLRAMQAGTYGDPVFQGVDGHGRVVGEDINALEAFAIEAIKG
jgi:predicted SAM-dependent methyltransferase